MASLDQVMSLEKIKEAHEALKKSGVYIRTPVLHHVQDIYSIGNEVDLHLKLESLQVMGSFKIRGVYNQLRQLPPGVGTDQRMLFAMSAGNYGKTFAFMVNKMKLKAKVLMPNTAPDNRAQIIQNFGVTVERMATTELLPRVEEYSQAGLYHLHSYDDPLVIQGAARVASKRGQMNCDLVLAMPVQPDMRLLHRFKSLGVEILEDVERPDIVLVCCGGGAVLAGTAAAIKLSGHDNCRIYGVEPYGSRCMYESYKAGHAVTMASQSLASGLSPPSAGENTFKLCQQYVDDILLVTDDELRTAMMVLYDAGLKVEASGAAALAALYHNKVPNTQGKKIVVVITGSNVTVDELVAVKNHLDKNQESAANEPSI